MKDMIRVVLIDPQEETRGELRQLLEGLGPVWLTEVCPRYSGAEKAITEQAPHLVVVVLDADPEGSVKLVGELARAHPPVAILPASRTRDGDLILRVMRAGAREFLPLPTDPNEVLGAVGRLVRPSSGGPGQLGGRVYTVLGAAGGVGCTSLAVNLATTMASEGQQSVALADFDLLMGVVDASLDIVPTYTMLEVAQSSDRLDLTLLKRSMTRHESSGLFVLPRPVSLEDAAKIDPEALRRVISLLKAICSTVVIDASKALQATDFVAFESSDVILLVVVMDLNCLRNSARLLHLFRQEGLADRVKVVANRLESRGFDISTRKAEEVLNMPVSWQIPNASKELNMARARGVPIEVVAARSPAMKAIRELARSLQGGQGSDRPPSRMSRFAASFF